LRKFGDLKGIKNIGFDMGNKQKFVDFEMVVKRLGLTGEK
jgi:hypothetical protein